MFSKFLKTLYIPISIGTIIIFSFLKVLPCEIVIEVQDNKKKSYNIGDTLIVKITVYLSHRICNVPMGDTKFETQGLKIIGVKYWKEVGYLTYEQALKLVVTSTKADELTIAAIRTCDKEGGRGKLSLPCDGCTGCSSGAGCPLFAFLH